MRALPANRRDLILSPQLDVDDNGEMPIDVDDDNNGDDNDRCRVLPDAPVPDATPPGSVSRPGVHQTPAPLVLGPVGPPT